MTRLFVAFLITEPSVVQRANAVTAAFLHSVRLPVDHDHRVALVYTRESISRVPDDKRSV